MNRGFYFDQSRCTGCFTCVIACKDWHEYEMGAEPEAWIIVSSVEQGKYPDISVTHLARQCYHCVRSTLCQSLPGPCHHQTGTGRHCSSGERSLPGPGMHALQGSLPLRRSTIWKWKRMPPCRSAIYAWKDGPRVRSQYVWKPARPGPSMPDG